MINFEKVDFVGVLMYLGLDCRGATKKVATEYILRFWKSFEKSEKITQVTSLDVTWVIMLKWVKMSLLQRDKLRRDEKFNVTTVHALLPL